jgi:hypothetical protein
MTLNSIVTWIGNCMPHPNLSSRREENGPTELADVVVRFLRGMPICGLEDGGWLSEAGLRQLITVAFFTSLAPEEGRYPQCSLFWSIYPHEWFDTCEFHPRRPLNVETLRRLAPICQLRGSAIRVALQENNLVLVGMTATRFEGLDLFPGRPGFVPSGRELNVQVHILGPGHIRADYGGVEFELRAGRIRSCPRLWSLPCVRALTTRFGESVGDAVISKLKLGDEEAKLFGGLHTCLQDEKLLELILRPILDHGHGGAVIAIPSRNVSWLNSSLEVTNKVTDLNLAERAVDHLAACVECHYPVNATQDMTSHIRRSLQTRGRLTVAAKTIGELASVDGCVILDRELSVVGFGTKINVTREEAVNSQIQFINARSDTPVELDELEKLGGTRLRSALWLCKVYPNVIAFVVSQDQTLTVLWSEETVAFAVGPIAITTIP